MKIYTVQQDKNGNVIVCADTIARNGYVIVRTRNNYQDAMRDAVLLRG